MLTVSVGSKSKCHSKDVPVSILNDSQLLPLHIELVKLDGQNLPIINAAPVFCSAGDSPHPPSRWDKLFIALEESHMRQNMLLESAERCCEGGTLMGQVHALLKGTFQQHMHSLVRVCGAQAEQAGLRLQDGLVERERRINATLEVILQSRREENSELKRLQEAVTTLSAGCMRASGNKLLPSDLKQEMTPPEDVDKIKGSLVAIVTELQKVHLQLSNTMAQAGVRRGRET